MKMDDQPPYVDLLANIARDWSDPQGLGLFTTHVGSRWGGQLMVCGRATNGMEPEWTCEQIATPADREAAVKATVAKRDEVSCPMEWIEDAWKRPGGYNTARSAFWRVTRALAARLSANPDDQHWASRLTWTNLYRVAPADGGNPSAQLKRVQFDWCCDRLMAELTQLTPRRLLILSGSNWAADFVGQATIKWRPYTQLVEGVGTWRLANGHVLSVVIAKHPQGKPEAALVRAIDEAFASVD